jgi:uncharacterized delta-60 repeat protein
MNRRSMSCLIIVCLAIFVFPFVASATQGELDTTFGSPDGYVTYYTPEGGGRMTAVAVQKDHKIVVADTTIGDTSWSVIMVRRYNTDGSADNTFGTNGVALWDDDFYAFATDVAIQVDGKIVVAGMVLNEGGDAYDLVLLRYLTNGTLDTTFGTGGVVTYEAVQWYDWLNTVDRLVIQDDGKIVVAGYTYSDVDYSNDMLLLRFNTSGTLDTTFGTGGVVTYDTYTYQDLSNDPPIDLTLGGVVARDVKMMDNGKIAVLISADYCVAVLIYNSNGTLNKESKPFCGGFEVPGYGMGATAEGMDIQKDGKIVIVGDVGDIYVLRFTDSLDYDRAFGTAEFGGGSYFNCSTFYGYESNDWRFNYSHGMVIQPDGKIVVVGNCPIDRNGDNYSDDQDLLVFRMTTGGELDTIFGDNGVFTFNTGWPPDGSATELGDRAMSVAIQPDGQIVVSGIYMAEDPETYDHEDGIVLRLNGEPLADVDVNPSPYAFGSVNVKASKVQSITIANNGKANLTVTKVDLTGGDVGMFKLEKGTCTNLGSFTLTPGQSCNVSVTFTPSSAGTKSTFLRVASNDPFDPWKDEVPWMDNLTGTAVQPPTTITLTVTRSGSGTGSVKSSPAGINCGATCSFAFKTNAKVTLTAKADVGNTFTGWTGAGCSGTSTCKVTVDASKTVNATFTAGTPDIAVTPTGEIHYSTKKLNTKTSKSFTVKNNGNGNLVIGTVNVQDINASGQYYVDAAQDKCSGKTFAPKKTCTFKIVFQPTLTTPQPLRADVHVPSNDPDSPDVVRQLFGAGKP